MSRRTRGRSEAASLQVAPLGAGALLLLLAAAAALAQTGPAAGAWPWLGALAALPPEVAAGFALAGSSLLLAAPERAGATRRRLAQALGAGSAVLGVLIPVAPDRPVPLSSAVPLVLGGTALVLLHLAPAVAQGLALGVEFVAVEVLLARAYGVGDWGLGSLEPMTPAGLIGFLALGAGVLGARPGQGLLRRLAQGGAGTFLARRLTVAAIALPAGLGWLVLAAGRLGGYGAPFGLMLFATAVLVVFTGLVWRTAGILNRMEEERRRAERRLRAQHTVTRTLAQSSSLAEAAPHLLEAIGQSLGWEVGAIWMLDETAGVLSCLETWHVPGKPAREFEALCRACRFAPGRGLPGRVWQERTPAWVPDVTRAARFPRAPVAARAGLRSAFAFAILVEGQVIGVVELFCREVRPPDPELLDVAGSLGSQVGQFVERMQAELAQRESEERYRRIVETANEGIWLLDAAGRTVYVNRRMAEMLGTEGSDLDGQPVWDFVFAEERSLLAERLADEAVGGREPFDFRFRRRDGGEVLVMGSTSPVADAQGRRAGLLGLFTDTTERRRALAEFQQAHQRFQLAAAAVQGVIYEWDVATDAVHRTQGLLEVFGYRPEEVPPEMEWWRQAIHPEDRERVKERFAAALSSGEAVSVEYRVRKSDGRFGHVWDRAVIVRDDALRAVRVVGSVMDLTERKWAEEALRESEGRFRSLSVCSPVGIFLTDTRGYCTYTNPRAQAICGFTFEQALAAGWAEFVDAEDRDRVLAAWSRATEAAGQYSDEMRFRRPDGLLRWVHMRSAPLRSDAGAVMGFVGTLEDITERKELETALRQRATELAEADRRKDEFLAMLAHELRNPLAPISNAVEVMRLRGPDPDTERARGAIERQVRHLTRLVDDLLDVSRITRGMVELRKERLELRDLVEQAVQTAQPLIQERGHQLTVSVAPGPLPVEGDSARLVQVLSNLLNNAAKYSESGGRIALSVEREDGQAVIRVSDTGKGIPPAMLARIFDVFTQVDPSLDRSEGGLGIGLSVVKRLVEMHGGSVEARSAGAGQGSEFVVRLPLLIPAAEPASPTPGLGPPPVTPTAPGTIRRVLVVDDNADSAESLTEMLALWGHETRTSFDGPAALALAESYHPEVVLLDIGLPGMDGYEVARRIREQPDSQRPLLVALTGYGQAEDRKRTRAAGFDIHLTKPVDPGQLQQLLSSLAVGVSDD